MHGRGWMPWSGAGSHVQTTCSRRRRHAEKPSSSGETGRRVSSMRPRVHLVRQVGRSAELPVRALPIEQRPQFLLSSRRMAGWRTVRRGPAPQRARPRCLGLGSSTRLRLPTWPYSAVNAKRYSAKTPRTCGNWGVLGRISGHEKGVLTSGFVDIPRSSGLAGSALQAGGRRFESGRLHKTRSPYSN